jgi:hypothetical protein
MPIYSMPIISFLSSIVFYSVFSAYSITSTMQVFLYRISFSQQSSSSQPVSPAILHTSLPSSTSSSSLFPVAPGALVLEEPKDYPHVRFWTRGDYKSSKPKNKVTTMNSVPGKRGGSRAAKDINVMHQYLEKSDGCVVSGREASAIRKT